MGGVFAILLITFELHGQRIFGGTAIDINQAPWQVSLEYNNSSHEHFCGGSIIDEQWILTASHCVEGLNPNEIIVHAGSTDQTNNNIGQRVTVDQIIMHPSYISPTSGNDVALLHLSDPLCFNANVNRIRLNTNPNNIGVGTQVNITGWGYHDNTNSVSSNLLSANSEIISNQDANQRLDNSNTNHCLPPSNSVGATSIGFFQEGIAAGPGDSGGPATILVNNERLLIGASSWGGCPRADHPTVYANTTSLIGFINSNINFINSNCLTCSPNHIVNNGGIVTGFQVYNQETLVTNDITIVPNGYLKVNSLVKFRNNAKIIIENGGTLEISGGHLTACGDQWQGVKMNGGTIKMNNKGKISKAFIGVLTLKNNNCNLICDDATFIDNTLGVVFYHSSNKAEFKKTNFSSMYIGVELNNLLSTTTFTDCNFNLIKENGITSNGSIIDVRENNTFNNCVNGVNIRNLFGNNNIDYIGHKFRTPNSFINCKKGIYSNNSLLEISNNNIENNEFGIYYSGLNQFSSSFNTFSGHSYAEGIYSAGSYSNISYDNIYKSDVGIFPWQDNNRYTFKNNCFTTQWWDVNVATGSQISSAQGTPNYAASNCFTKNGVPDFICQSNNTVLYYIPKDINSPVCMKPETQGNYSLIDANDYNKNGCGGSSGFQGDGEYEYITKASCDSLKLQSIINALLTVISNNASNTSNNGKWLTAYSDRHLNFAINTRAECLRKDGNLTRLKDFYNECISLFPTEIYYKIKSAEVSYQSGNFSQAKSEIEQLKIAHPTKSEVLEAINLSMDILQSNNNINLDNIVDQNDIYIRRNTLSQQNVQLLRRVAISSDPFAAYGRALLHYLTGENLEPFVNPAIVPFQRINAKHQTDYDIIISPNPTSDMIKIRHNSNTIDENSSYSISNILGIIILDGKLNDNYTNINISDLANGMYILSIKMNGKIIKTEKIVKQ